MMNDFRFYSKDFLLGFIKVYKSLPSLWQLKNPEYHNRDKKNKDYDIIIKKMKEIEPRADKDSVAKKISNLRSVYKRECKRLLKENPGKKPEELVSNNIWYFHHLHFLQEQQKTPKATAITDTTATTTTATDETSKDELDEQDKATTANKRKADSPTAAADEPKLKLVKLASQSSGVQSKDDCIIKLEDLHGEKLDVATSDFFKQNDIMLPDLILKSEPEEPLEMGQQHHHHVEHDSDDLVSEVGASTINSDHANSDNANSDRAQNFGLMERNNYDRFDHMTSAWAGILRNLERSQQIFAEKLINDVMFEAQLENLSRQSVLIAVRKEKQNGIEE